MIRIATAIALVIVPSAVLAQQTRETFKDANGRTLGRSSTDTRGNTTYYDSMGRNTGRSSTSSNGTTTIYDSSGRKTGTITTPPKREKQ
jgi:hypothetical protein